MRPTEEETTKTAIRGFYETWGPLYTRLRDLGRDDHEDKSILIDILTPFDNDVVLDVGTGPGTYALRVADNSLNCQIIGIDLSPSFVGIACHKAAERAVENVSFQVGDIESLEFSDGQFSKILCAGVLSVVTNRTAAVSEMARVMRPGARLAVREPVRSDGALARFFSTRSPTSRLRRLGSAVGLMFGHFSPDFMTKSELEALFDKRFFSKVSITEHASDLLIEAVR
jgi:ubiquinone/menaquinone biosynthesis C-methylase UbiE